MEGADEGGGGNELEGLGWKEYQGGGDIMNLREKRDGGVGWQKRAINHLARLFCITHAFKS